MNRYDFTVFGCATSVCIMKVNGAPAPGKTVWIESSSSAVYDGGVGFNICWNLASLGLRVYPVLTCSDERIEKLLREDYCARFGWPKTGLFSPPAGHARTCYMLQDEEHNHTTILYPHGTPREPEHALEIPDEYLNHSRMVIFASTRPINTEPVLRALQRADTPYVFSYRNDPIIFPPRLLREILFGARILFMNEAEAEQVVRQYGLRDIAELFDQGRAEVLAVTQGKRGGVVYDCAGGCARSVHVPVTENELGNVDAVGAGDAFLAGFLYGYTRGKSLETCAQYGSTMSSFVIEREGSTTNTPSEQMLLARNRTRPDARDD